MAMQPMTVNFSAPNAPEAAFGAPPGLDAPPGLCAPPGLAVAGDSTRSEPSLAEAHARLAEENLRLRLALCGPLPHHRPMAVSWPAAWSDGALAHAPRVRAGTWCADTATRVDPFEQLARPRVDTWCAELGKVADVSGLSSTSTQVGDSEADSEELKTTVVLRNIPLEFTRENVRGLLDSQGFQGTFDFLYLPHQFSSQKPFGYMFINFVEAKDADRFFLEFSGFDEWGNGDGSKAEVAWSTGQQGLEAQVGRFRNSPVMHPSVDESMQPALYHRGVRVPFPAPTASIKAPRTRKNSA